MLCDLRFRPVCVDLWTIFVYAVCWRNLAGTEESSRYLEELTADRPKRRLRADNSVEALWESAPDSVPPLKSGKDSSISTLQQDKMHTKAMTLPFARPLNIPRDDISPHGVTVGRTQVPNAATSAPRASLCRAPTTCL